MAKKTKKKDDNNTAEAMQAQRQEADAQVGTATTQLISDEAKARINKHMEEVLKKAQAAVGNVATVTSEPAKQENTSTNMPVRTRDNGNEI